MSPPEDFSQPRLATGCRWGAESQDGDVRIVLFPEGAIKLQGTGRQVLERCDGQRTFGEIISELQIQFGDADPGIAGQRGCYGIQTRNKLGDQQSLQTVFYESVFGLADARVWL